MLSALALPLLLVAAMIVFALVARRAAASPAPSAAGVRESLVPWRANVLVLDMDETLVHAVQREGGELEVFFRPHVHEFLERVSGAFREVVLFTAATKPYADQVLDVLDPDGRIFSRRFYRESCTVLPDGSGVAKDLRLLRGVDLGSVVLVDNTPTCFTLQPDNGIPILSWVGQPDDEELLRMLPFLVDEVAPARDVRAVVSGMETKKG